MPPRAMRPDDILTAAQVEETAASIAAMQEPDGAIPWTVGEHTDVWNHVESAMALLVGGQVEAAERAYDWARLDAACRRLVADEDRRRRDRGPLGRDQHVGLPRRRRLAPLADPSRRGVRPPPVADRAPRARLGRQHAAALRWHRVVAGVGRRCAGDGQRRRAARRLVEHLPEPARGRRARRPARRPAARVGAHRRSARPRAARAPRPVPRQVRVLDGLVLPGPRWRRPRRRRRAS